MDKLKIIIPVIIIFIFLIYIITKKYKQDTYKNNIAIQTLTLDENINNDFDKMSLDVVSADIDTYSKFSNDVKDSIIYNIKSASKRFNIPIILLHAIIRIESEYNFWVTHNKVNIKVNGKKITTNAIGLGGVIWEFWSDSLKTYNIANVKSDLYIPQKNIQATAAILSFIVKAKLRSNSITEHNLIKRIIAGYYGAEDKIYFSKMVKVSSDLWLKRISREMLLNRGLKIEHKFSVENVKNKK